MREFLLPYMTFDEHSAPDQVEGYPVNSLYLDTPALTLYRQTVLGLKNRFKLRIRFYDDNPDHPAFLEIKRRETDVIRKKRAAVTRDAVHRLMHGGYLTGSHLASGNGDPRLSERSLDALQNFCHLKNEIGADASLYVCYLREAYVSPNSDNLRITFDRQVRGCPYERRQGLRLPRKGVDAAIRGVILEIKFTDRFPGWVHQMVQYFHLQRCSVPKYIECVNAAMHVSGAHGLRYGGIIERLKGGAP
jgi:hypothetical protein